MTNVAFHFNVPDKPSYLCRLLRKVVGAGMRALVLAPQPLLDALDHQLWVFSQEDFISHARLGDSPQLAKRSAVLLADSPCDAGHTQVLINCLPDVPAGFGAFERVVEIVSTEDEDRALARARWKHYVQLGYELVRHDLALRQQESA
jgi:DNA polymerase-3 subunit chi